MSRETTVKQSGVLDAQEARKLPVRAILASILLLILSGSVIAFAIVVAPAIDSQAPFGSVREAKPMLVLTLKNAESLKASDVHIRLDGRSVAARPSVQHGTVLLNLPRVAEGSHSISFTTDRFGLFRRKLHAAWTFNSDFTAPPLRVISPRRHLVRRGVGTVSYSVKTEPNATLRLTAGENSSNTAAGANGRVTGTVKLHEGLQNVRVAAVDDAGNTTVQNRAVLSDTRAPRFSTQIRSSQSASGDIQMDVQVIDASKVTLTATVDAKSETVDVRYKDGVARITRVEPPLYEGEHVIGIRAKDSFGHATRKQLSVLVDSTEQLGTNGIGRGARGRDVLQLQRILLKQKYFKGSATREMRFMRYGPATANAVKQYQAAHGIAIDGIAGEKTIGALIFKIEINRSSHTLTLFRLGKIVKSYGVAVGQSAYPTPSGTFQVVDMQKDPTWTPPPDAPWAKGAKPIPPGPNNPLGTRWMGLDAAGVGIHGTNAPASIGYSLSHGCIRMRIPDVEDLFERVMLGTTVVIT